MAFTFTVNRSTNDELDITVAALDPDTSGAYTFPPTNLKEIPSVSLVPLGTGFFAGSWRVSAVTPTGLTITKLGAGGTASGGARLFIKRPR